VPQFDAYYLPLESPQVEAITTLLRERGVFVPTFRPGDIDIYDPITYRIEALHLNTETQLLADRNLVTRWISLVSEHPCTPEHRVAAAVMAFAQCANIVIEPSIALYEVAATNGNTAANKELHNFRVADNLSTTYWAEIVLSNSTSLVLPKGVLPIVPLRAEVDFEMPLRRWRRLYVVALKIAELELRGGDSFRNMMEILRWMYEDFLISAPSVMLACHYLAPNSNRKRLLKNPRSPDRERAIAGVKNATWDLTLLTEWLTRISAQNERNTLTLLCSLDEKVLSFARALAEVTPTPDQSEITFRSFWGPTYGTRLAAQLQSYEDTADNPDRQIHKVAGQMPLDDLICKGEQILRNWHPKHTGGVAEGI
jgi:hypothetical protein